MKVLSWDVGIINLAYCMIEYIENDWKIIDWGIINLTNRQKYKCINCGKNASCYTNLDNNEIYYCKKHLPKDLNPPEFEHVFIEKNDAICSWQTEKSKCKSKCKYMCTDNEYKNNYYCRSHAKTIYKRIENRYSIKNIKKKSVGSLPIENLKLKLINILDTHKNFLQVDIVLIENQPSMKNPKMKAISSTIFDYFMIRGLVDKDITNSIINIVKFMSPSNKLKLADEGDTKKLVKLKGNDAKTYKLTKSLGIKYCSEMIKPYDKWVNLFNSYKKKDDLADSFLQGMYYFNERM
jgi:hypothetical protein